VVPYWEDGKCYLTDTFHIPPLSVDVETEAAFQRIAEKGGVYVQSENLECYAAHFEASLADRHKFRLVILRRRFLCIVGRVLETVAARICMLMWSRLRPGSEGRVVAGVYSSDGVIVFEVTVVVIIICMSDYSWTLGEIARTFSTKAELHARLVQRTSSSWLDSSGA